MQFTISYLKDFLQPAWQVAVPSAKGISTGFSLVEAYRDERSMRAGRNFVWSSTAQIFEIYLAEKQLFRALKAARFSLGIPSGLRYTPILLAPFFGWVASRDKLPLTGKKIALWIHDHIGGCSLLVAAVSSVALIILGQPILGGSTLVFLGLGFLERYAILPLKVRQIIRQASLPVAISASLILGDPLEKGLAVFQAIVTVGQALVVLKDKRKRTRQTQDQLRKPITLEQLKKLPLNVACKLQKAHIHWQPLQPEQKVEIKNLGKIASNIDWKGLHHSMLQQKLKTNERWQQSLEPPLTFLNRNLQKLIESTSQRKILAGEPAKYEMLHLQLKQIAQDLPFCDDLTRADVIAQLAIEGGESCGAAIGEVVENVYLSLYSQKTTISLEEKILLRLAFERKRQFEAIYQTLWKRKNIHPWLKQSIDFRDICTRNQLLKGLLEDIGVVATSAQNDQTTTVDPVQGILVQSMAPDIKRIFWGGDKKLAIAPYDSARILRLLSDSRDSGIAKSCYYDWWRVWIHKQTVSKSEKDAFLSLLEQGDLEEIDPSTAQLRFKQHYLSAMLHEMGIVQTSSLSSL